MALNLKDYIAVKNESNLKIHKRDNSKFLFDFRYEGKRYRKTYHNKKATDWNKTTYIADAKRALQAYKDNIEAGFSASASITLNKLFELYCETLDNSKEWTRIKKQNYDRYIRKVFKSKNSKTNTGSIKAII